MMLAYNSSYAVGIPRQKVQDFIWKITYRKRCWRGGGEKGGVMTQTLYAHMNKRN
jgi:hypothetical protein